MIIKNTIRLADGSEISFGMPDSEKEMAEMFSLRYDVYVSEKKYIPTDPDVTEKKEQDQYDLENKCVYFIAVRQGTVIGCARMIRSVPLPTESDYYRFVAPKEIAAIPPTHRAEIGRIISRPRSSLDTDVPRHVIMLGLFYSMAEYGRENDIRGGYGSIKSSALAKIRKIGIPFTPIRDYTVTYDPDTSKDPLKNFFSDGDPVKLVYFITDKAYVYMDAIFRKSSFFRQVDTHTFLVRGKRTNPFDGAMFRLRRIFSF